MQPLVQDWITNDNHPLQSSSQISAAVWRRHWPRVGAPVPRCPCSTSAVAIPEIPWLCWMQPKCISWTQPMTLWHPWRLKTREENDENMMRKSCALWEGCSNSALLCVMVQYCMVTLILSLHWIGWEYCAKVCSSMTHSWMCNDMHPLLSISLLAMNCYELLLVTPIGSPTWIKMGFQWVFNGLWVFLAISRCICSLSWVRPDFGNASTVSTARSWRAVGPRWAAQQSCRSWCCPATTTSPGTWSLRWKMEMNFRRGMMVKSKVQFSQPVWISEMGLPVIDLRMLPICTSKRSGWVGPWVRWWTP